MNNYDFSNLLSPLRFEQMVRDLLSSKYGQFENFAEGADNGIDFRFSKSPTQTIIVQCKRYSTTSSLINNLKKEALKIEKLCFSEYLLVTSLDLTPDAKTKIRHILQNSITDEKIITRSDLNALLGLPENEFIELKYPELWMKSINIHQKLFSKGFLDHSQFMKERIEKSLETFVATSYYFDIIHHLESNNAVIISGQPGIGKTTLSYAIISYYILKKGYQLVDLSYRKIQEGENPLVGNSQKIILLDDVLGKIKLDKGEDFAQLLKFLIDKVERSDNLKLVATSREYILRKANIVLFSAGKFENEISKYILELNQYTRKIRMEILYNYVNSSDISIAHLESFLDSDYLKIIDHNNFNPRVIEELTKKSLVQNIRPDDYFHFFLENLENPLIVWQNVYDNLPNKLYKLVLILIFLLEDNIPFKHLQKAVNHIIRNNNEFGFYSYDDLEYILKELDGTFLKFIDSHDELVDEDYLMIEFENPSIKDFIDNFIWEKEEWLILIIQEAIFFELVFSFELSELAIHNDRILSTIRNKILLDFDKFENAGIGYFEFDTGEESFECWTQTRYYYYLNEISNYFPVDRDTEMAVFLSERIFSCGMEVITDISEKQSFCSLAEALITNGYIDGGMAINHYLKGNICDRKELICFEYMTRVCDEKSVASIKRNTQLIHDSDQLFLDECKRLKELDYFSVMEFYEDFHQIRNILPLQKTESFLKDFESTNYLLDSFEKLKSSASTLKQKDAPDRDDYHDIEDDSIKEIMNRINKEQKKTNSK